MAESTKLPKDIFAVEVPNHELLKLAYDSYLANARLASATTKQRGTTHFWPTAARQALPPKPAAKFAAAARNRGNKKEPAEHVLARPATQSGATVVSFSGRAATKTTARNYPRLASTSLCAKL